MPTDFRRVWPTQEEIEEFKKTHSGRLPGIYRVRCLACDKRIWGSGLGIGAHRRHCKGRI